MDDLHADITCVCETWFDTKNGVFSKKIRDSGYELHHAYREGKRGGGVAIMYKKTLTVKEGEQSTTRYMSFEYACITITLQLKRNILLVCLYRKQEIPFNTFYDEITAFMDRMIFKADAIMLVGDFNVWVDIEGDKNANQLSTLMSACGLEQQVAEPTHRDGHTLDHVYVNEFQMTLKHQVIHDTLGLTTDHYPIQIELPSSNVNEKKQTIQYRKLKDIEMEDFRVDLQESCDALMQANDSEFVTMCKQYHDLSASVMDKHSPILTRTCKTAVPKWIDKEYIECRALRRKYEKQWKKNKTEEHRLKYVNQKKMCADLAVSKQSDHYTKVIDNAGSCQKTLFKVANTLLDKNKVKILPTYSDPKELANEFNNYFIEKVKKIRKSIPKPTEVCTYSRPFKGVKMNAFSVVSEEEVKKLIQKSGIKTCAEDPIPGKLMQLTLDILLPVLTKLVNLSLQGGSMEGIKESILDPLLKKHGLDSDEYKNFRPVNNLLFLSKLIERAAGKQMDDHMTANNLHEPSQFAYKVHHNTETMMLGVTDEVLRGFDEGQATIIIFLDLSAAFDTIDVEKVLEIMEVEIGIGGVALKWFRSFLEGRKQKVKIENEYSESLDVPCGAPQGSVLGPKIFNVNVRSQPIEFKKCMFSSSSFADDSNGRKQFALTFQFNVINMDIVNCLNKIINWSNNHFMKINPDKTEILLLCPASLNKEVVIKGVFFEEQCIRFSEQVKNVGVWIDKNLTMGKHISQVVSHSYKILKDVGRIKKCLQQTQLERLVHAMTLSLLDYCNCLFVNVSKENIFKLQKLQNAAAKLVLGKRKRDSASEALKTLHWLNVEARITFKILLLVFKILKGQCSQNMGLCYKTFNGRDDDYLLLDTPIFKTAYGKRIFAYNGARLWNALPAAIRMEEDIEKYKKSVKTILFDGCAELKRKAFKYNA